MTFPGVTKMRAAEKLIDCATGLGVDREYRRHCTADLFHRQAGTTAAVVIHLFYTENWPLFKEKLRALEGYTFDLYVTIPAHNLSYVPTIKETFPDARVVVVPNRGRDVLPFIRVAERLHQAGYEAVLKFHSKKSTHRPDGQDWLEQMIDQLLPRDRSLTERVMAALADPVTGIIGPSGVYYPLTVNFPANGPHMMRVVRELYNRNAAERYLQTDRRHYGFFAGTMFWARLDAIHRLLHFSALRFEREAGQIDATFAHALERLFCVVPEIEHRKLYELTRHGLQERPYRSDEIPAWSTAHDK